MKRLTTLLLVVALFAVSVEAALAAQPAPTGQCTKIQSGQLKDSKGNVLTTGFDKWGYNYQAHMFNGFEANYSRPNVPVTSGDVSLEMKWSDDWLADSDCNGDGMLDRGGSSGISKGWLTNHYRGTYIDDAGHEQHWTSFTKIVWMGPGGSLWGQYEIVQDIYNDPAGGYHGPTFKAVRPGFGLNDHWTTQ